LCLSGQAQCGGEEELEETEGILGRLTDTKYKDSVEKETTRVTTAKLKAANVDVYSSHLENC